MRTSEEIRAFVMEAQKDKTPDGWCRKCLNEVLAFIDSDPPCKHPNARFIQWTDYVSERLGGLRAAHCISATHCPDCGEKLKEKD